MKIGKVERYIREKIKKENLLFVLIDPLDYKTPKNAISSAIAAAEAGASAILIGGSIGVQGELLDNVASSIKRGIKDLGSYVPIILFPGNIATLTKYADALYFMSLLNSRNPYWISQAQTLASPIVKKIGIEPLPVGYIVVEPGGSVGWVGDANLVPRDRPKIATALALAGQFMGSRFILMDVGSASKLGPVPLEMVKSVKENIDVPLIVAGGMKNENDAEKIVKSGADIIQMGTIVEKASNVKTIVKKIVKKLK